jgi:hypothetical protein
MQRSGQWLINLFAPERNLSVRAITALRGYQRTPRVSIIVAKHEVPHIDTLDIPQLHYDQLRNLNTLQHMRRQRTTKHKSAQIFLLTTRTKTIMLTRSQLKKREDYQQWRIAEWAQHNKYKTQRIFGLPITRPPGAVVLPFVWAYMIKVDPITGKPVYKARGTCNGGKRYGKAITMAETYAMCCSTGMQLILGHNSQRRTHQRWR